MDGIDWEYWDKQLIHLPLTLNLNQFCKAVGVSPKVVRENWIYSGRIEATDIGSKRRPAWRIYRDQVAVFMTLLAQDGRNQMAEMDPFELWERQNRTWWNKTVKEWTEWAKSGE